MNLNKFNSENLFTAATDLFAQLGIKLNSNTAESLSARELLGNEHFKDNDTFHAIAETYYIGTIDDSIFEATNLFDQKYSIDEAREQADRNYNGLMLFALSLSKAPTRTEISTLTRAFNRISQKMPVALLLKYELNGETTISLAISERFKFKQVWRQGEKAGKVIILRDICAENTHAGHQRILSDLAKPAGVSNYAQLHERWLEVLDVNILNKKFYQELTSWYFWAMDVVEFPDDEEKDREVRNATNLIRLITRIIFIWFIKEKSLIPNSLFDKNYLKTIVQKFNEDEKSKNYYPAVLQNLFFATLNQKMEERKFAKDGGSKTINKAEYGVKTLFRYAHLFKISQNDVLQLYKDIPFLNGGLFDCLDNPKGENKYIDGFSRNPRRMPYVPDVLFFGEERNIDLNDIFATRNKRYKAKGLINLLESYKFTIAENTPLEEDVALDPELLGKVFENLLASYNPETKTTARKQTGSFYTPREIVNYMVDESLLEYLKQACSNKSADAETLLRKLFAYENDENPFDETETRKLIEALNHCKILDPACGSGAFPMGILHRMVHILQKLDPGNELWKEQQREKIIGEQIRQLEKDKRAIEGLSDRQVREKAVEAVEERLEELEEIFNRNYNFDDYSRKLYLIENCIYGIDIQPIAVQIAKLRFFISLVIDQKANKEKDNFGIRSLPNLETKFVAANTLIGLEMPTTDLFSENNPIKQLQEQLKTIRHEYFTATTRARKLQLQEHDKQLRREMSALISETLIRKNEEQVTSLELQLQEAQKLLGKFQAGPEQKETIETVNLFGQTETTIVDKKKARIKHQKTQIRNIEKQINAIKSASTGDDIQKIAEKIVAFDPYDQNQSSEWFDMEWMFGVSDGFNVVIGNPPYGAKLNDIDEYKKLFPKTSIGNIDSYKYFIEQGLKLTTSNGCLLYITSDSYLEKEYFKDVRMLICENAGRLLNVKLGDDVFENVSIPTAILFITISNEKIAFYADVSNLIPEEKVSNIKINSREVKYSINFTGKSNPFSKQDFYKLIDVYDQVMGVKVYQIGKGKPKQSKIEIEKDMFVSSNKINNLWKPFADDGIKRYVFTPTVKYIKYGEWLAEPRKTEYFVNPKVLIREVVNPRVFACYVKDEYVIKNTAAVIIQKNKEFELLFLLGILNSRIFDYYISSQSPKTSNTSFPSISSNLVKKFPIPKINKKINGLVFHFVDQILSTKQSNPHADTTSLENRIDELVFKLYDLTYDEVKVIVPDFWLSEAEYEKVMIQ